MTHSLTTSLPVLVALLLLSLFCTCDPAPKTSVETSASAEVEDELPVDLKAVFDAHGGIQNWRAFRQLSYAMPRDEKATETQLVDLYTRRERIEQPANDVVMGHDGKHTWIVADTTYKGNPAFYKNLYFYFYAMPWVLADDGINYTETEPLVFDGQTYPGILISYDDGVGFSPKDNYRLHYDTETKRMRWLGYTVTGRSGKPSDKFSWIEYPTFSDYGGVELPDSLVWYTVEENQPVAPRRAQLFTDVKLTDEAPADDTFAMPSDGRIAD